MLSLFRKRSKAPVFDAPAAPDEPLAVIGDLHGSDGLLDRLLQSLTAPEMPARQVFVGDYVDRGENSARVLELLMQYQKDAPDRVICLMGNHERMLIDFLDMPTRAGKRWLRFGGAQTLASFRIPPLPETAPDEEWITLRDRFEDALGPAMEAWLRALPLSWQSGNVAVVHAAADPRAPIDGQSEQALLWGHPDFEDLPRSDGVWVVHGHTIVAQPQAEQGRIAVDTGAYATGKLTAALIGEGEIRFHTA